MDYFNFEEASNAVPSLDLDMPSTDMSSMEPIQDVDFDPRETAYPNPTVNNKAYGTTIKLRMINDCEVEGILWDHNDGTDFPVFRARQACSLCDRMGLDCFLASRGALITGCTCCISLFRECSFTHPLPPKGYVPVMSGIAEDSQMCQGVTTESKPPMKSYEDAKSRKTGARFPRDAVKILKRWLSEHADHPYPNEREKEELKQLTGLKKSQVANWLANARRRGKVRPPSGPSSPMLGAIDIPKAISITDLNPMDRWKASPPENEPARMTDIARAVSAAPQEPTTTASSLHNSRASSRKASSEDDSNWSVFRAPTVSSFDTRESTNSDLSFASSHSHRSKISKTSQSSAERRRRRRAPMTQRAAVQATRSRGARIFQCTFCTDAFPSKYDWQRHEKSLHLALERWICCPTGGTIAATGSGPARCVFCPETNPSEEHLETHNFSACHEKSIVEQTFYRKDHLRQHLKLIHSTKFNAAMESWKSVHNEIKSRCGFCSEVFSTWQQRVDHLSVHFRSGADMANWSGDWGLEPEIERGVENAIPPYLIGAERSTLNPYIAKAAVKRGSTHASAPISPTRLDLSYGSTPIEDLDTESVDVGSFRIERDGWTRFERDALSQYVHDQCEKGVTPTDKEIQDYARISVYGDADPLDWTCADNETWLNAFKSKVGLTNTACSIDTGIHRSDKSSQGPATPAIDDFAFPPLMGENLDADMQLDFHAADFASLNLDELVPLDVNGSSGKPQNIEANTMGSVNIPFTPQQALAAGQTMFEPFDMLLDMPQEPATTVNDQSAMSAHDFNQLTQYMAGFQMKKL